MNRQMRFNVQSIVLVLCFAIAASCRNGIVLKKGVTEKDKSDILEAHNRLRAMVAMGKQPGQPGAENMREMVWDDELAARAQTWANECTFKHDPQRRVDRFTMGQNVAIMWSTEPLAEDDGDFPSRIQSWFNEVQKYAFGSKWSSKTGHYSQLVWGETSLVGCGFAYYKDSRKYNKLFVCNYGPGGNVIGSNPYAVGAPSCVDHGMKPSPHYQGLCQLTAKLSSPTKQILTTIQTAVSHNAQNTIQSSIHNAVQSAVSHNAQNTIHSSIHNAVQNAVGLKGTSFNSVQQQHHSSSSFSQQFNRHSGQYHHQVFQTQSQHSAQYHAQTPKGGFARFAGSGDISSFLNKAKSLLEQKSLDNFANQFDTLRRQQEDYLDVNRIRRLADNSRRK